MTCSLCVAMASWVEASSRDRSLSLSNPEKPLEEPAKPALTPKPHLMPKPFALQRNTTVRPIRAPQTNFRKVSSSDALLENLKPETPSQAPIKQDIKETVNVSNQSQATETVPKPDSKPKPEPNQSQISKPGDHVVNVQHRSRAKSLGSRDEKAQADTEGGKLEARCWPTRNRLSTNLTSKFEAPSQPYSEDIKMQTELKTEKEKQDAEKEPNDAEKQQLSGGSIKRRISLLFDRSAASQRREAFNKRDNAPSEMSLDIKQRIQSLSLDTPRTGLPSAGAPKSPSPEKNHSDEQMNERKSEENKPNTREINNSTEKEEEDKENHLHMAVYRRVGINLDEGGEQSEEEKERPVERKKEEQNRKTDEEETRRQADQERIMKEQEKEREKKIKEETERLKVEERLRKEREMEAIRKEKEMEEERKRIQEEERRKEEERLRKEREMEAIRKEKEIEEERKRFQEEERRKEEERLRKEREIEMIKKEKEIEEERKRIQEEERRNEEERLRKERDIERIHKEKEREEERQKEEERLRIEQENIDMLKKEKEISRRNLEMESMKEVRKEGEREEVPTAFDLISFDSPFDSFESSASQTLITSKTSPQPNEVIYDDFSVKPQRWGTRTRHPSSPSPTRKSPLPILEWSVPGSQGPAGDQVHVKSSEDLTGFEPEAFSTQKHSNRDAENGKASSLDGESKPEDRTQSTEDQLADCEAEEDAAQEEMEETGDLEICDAVDDSTTETRLNLALQRLNQRRQKADEETADASEQEELEPLPVLESAAPPLDSSVFRSKVDLGKKRSIKRITPSRAVRQKASLLTVNEGTLEPDWRFCDSTDAKVPPPATGGDSESEEELSQDVSPAPSQPKRVPVFPGMMDQSALMAQLKRRSGAIEANAPSEAQTPPSIPSRSPRTPSRSLGPRVLPAPNEKDSGRSGPSPSWLLELKSKKRMNQPESEASDRGEVLAVQENCEAAKRDKENQLTLLQFLV
ncbi:hypothetical protein DNTS_029678 [Danionella cerebrum]|uniref:Tankyrase 1-binding protein C-terminal domain-containing protein n=1 Tax=Danionella cerebrum TaxID=2873325 RepID=A0A553QFQ2_9TELE|nr:hypothetical protein DNTS_029678 [Danionella translucida]